MSRYIDADSITEELRAWQEAMKKRGNETMAEDYEHCIDLIHQEPTADVRENVGGEWVIVVDRTEMYDKEGVKTWGILFQCNQCGFVLNAIEGHTGQYNYCPSCGAQMVRGES